MELCAYCNEPRTNMENWHDCAPSRDAKARVDTLIQDITRIASGVPQPSEPWNRNRKERLGDMAQYIRLGGNETKPMGHEDGK